MSHAIKHSTSLPVENVRIQKPLRHLPNGKAKAQDRPRGEAQQKQSTPPVCVPDLRRLAHDEQMIDDLDGYRELAIEILNLAIEDVDLRDDYETQANRTAAERNRASAISFIKSRWCEEICEAIGTPYDRAKAAAFK
jgi:hypothetical protein